MASFLLLWVMWEHVHRVKVNANHVENNNTQVRALLYTTASLLTVFSNLRLYLEPSGSSSGELVDVGVPLPWVLYEPRPV